MNCFADTNVLLAFILPDRPKERIAAGAWLAEHGPLTITEAVMVEASWVLQKRVGSAREVVASQLKELLRSPDFIASDQELFAAALDIVTAMPSLSLVDGLLAARQRQGQTVVTFDRRLDRVLRED